jgi:hypothetical protein
MTPVETPWGPSQSSTEIAPGIVFHSTASHGGYHLSPARVASMPKPLREFQPWAEPGWYEEDCDWYVVAWSFPQYFPDDAREAALSTLRRYRPEMYGAFVAVAAGRGR